MKKLIVILSFIVFCFTATACSVENDPKPSVTPGESPAVSASASTAPAVSASVSAQPTITPAVSVSASTAPAVSASVSTQPTLTPAVTVSASTAPAVSASVSTQPTITPAVSATPGITPTVIPSVPMGPTDAELLSAVTFSNSTKNYNGEKIKLEVKNLPLGATVSYAVNPATTSAENIAEYDVERGVRKPGVYGVTATVTLGNASRSISAVLTVKKAKLTIRANGVQKELYAPHPEFTYTVSGLKGDDVFYFGGENPNNGVDGGSERATFTGDLVLSTEVDRYTETGGAITVTAYPESDCYTVTPQDGLLSIKPLTTKLLKGTSGGLKMNGDCAMTYNGKVVTWQGINFFSLVSGNYNNKGEIPEAQVQEIFRALEDLAAYNVKTIRFSVGFFTANDWTRCYFDYDKATGTYVEGEKAKAYKCLLHRIFNKAASLNIGLIPSVYWTANFVNLHGETEIDCFTNHNSKSHRFAVEFQRMLLENYNDHPALFMWEFGNEWNLKVDVKEGGLTSDHLIAFRAEWTELIQSYNTGYNRVIGSGDSNMRPAQYNRRYGGTWKNDTLAEHKKILRELNPGITALSSHDYPRSRVWLLIDKKKAEYKATNKSATDEQLETIANTWREKYYKNPQEVETELQKYGITYNYTGPYTANMTNVDTMAELFSLLVNSAKEMGATCYVGETNSKVDYGETVLQHSKYRNSVLSNGMVIDGDKLNSGLDATYAEANGYYPETTYEDWLQAFTAITAAQKTAKLPLLMYWNYHPSTNITRLNEEMLRDQLNGWGERGSAVEFSMSLTHFGKAHIVLNILKEANDAWDAANPGAYN